eukprot:m.95909 g.95909  ORF g.95909 m.95909 type:complete len:408 (-) comp10130_c0_seq3:232-1455(-)
MPSSKQVQFETNARFALKRHVGLKRGIKPATTVRGARHTRKERECRAEINRVNGHALHNRPRHRVVPQPRQVMVNLAPEEPFPFHRRLELTPEEPQYHIDPSNVFIMMHRSFPNKVRQHARHGPRHGRPTPRVLIIALVGGRTRSGRLGSLPGCCRHRVELPGGRCGGGTNVGRTGRSRQGLHGRDGILVQVTSFGVAHVIVLYCSGRSRTAPGTQEANTKPLFLVGVQSVGNTVVNELVVGRFFTGIAWLTVLSNGLEQPHIHHNVHDNPQCQCTSQQHPSDQPSKRKHKRLDPGRGRRGTFKPCTATSLLAHHECQWPSHCSSQYIRAVLPRQPHEWTTHHDQSPDGRCATNHIHHPPYSCHDDTGQHSVAAVSLLPHARVSAASCLIDTLLPFFTQLCVLVAPA